MCSRVRISGDKKKKLLIQPEILEMKQYKNGGFIFAGGGGLHDLMGGCGWGRPGSL